jgi:hypothetical protein
VSDYVMSESDINKPAELRSTSLLGTFEEQRMMKILHRQAGAATEETQDRLRTSMEEFQRYQEEMMKKYEDLSVRSFWCVPVIGFGPMMEFIVSIHREYGTQS